MFLLCFTVFLPRRYKDSLLITMSIERVREEILIVMVIGEPNLKTMTS